MIALDAYFAVSALVIVTPGQDTALVVRNSLAAGRRGGAFTAVGVVLGQAAWTLAAAAGLTAVLLAWAPVFEAIRLAGAAYLIWLGVVTIRRAFRAEPATDGRQAEAEGSTTRDGERRRMATSPRAMAHVRQGLLSAMGNPKLALFFTSLFPQFVPQGSASLAAMLGLGLIFCTMTLVWLTAYAAVVGSARRWFERGRIRRAVETVLGAALVAFGVRLATEERS